MHTISVVIPVYNGAATIVRALDSVLQQTLAPLEVLVVDDGSQDDTRSVVDAYVSQSGRRSVRLICQENGGPASARDAGIRAAKGTHVALLDADDTWLPTKLEVSYAFLSECDLDLVGANVRSGSTTRPCRVLSRMSILFRNPYFTSTTVFLRSAYFEVGGFDLGQRYSEDYKLWLAFSWKGKRCGLMRERLAEYRPHQTGAHRGLSSHRWKMQVCELRNYSWLANSRLAPRFLTAIAQAFSTAKFLIRLALGR